MRGGSEQVARAQSNVNLVVLLDGGYMENESEAGSCGGRTRCLWQFTAYQNGENVEIHFSRMLSSPTTRNIPQLNMTLDQYINVFLPVVDSGANNHQPLMLRGINYRGLPGSWWSRALLEPRPNQGRPNQGGYKRRQRFSAKIVAYEHKKRSHKRRKSYKNSYRRRH